MITGIGKIKEICWIGGTWTGWIPAGKWARIRTVNVTGTPTFTIQPDQQEVLQ